MPNVVIGKGPAWLRAIEFTLMSSELLGNKRDPENNRAVKRTCAMVGATIKTLGNQIAQLMSSGAMSSTDNWELLHKKTHEAWEMSKLKDIMCDRFTELVPEGALTPGVEEKLRELLI